jgi:hypothetical protein
MNGQVERLQACRARREVGEPAQPDEAIGGIAIAELPDHAHPLRLLRLDELAIEQIDQRVALAGMQRVLPELENLTGIADGRVFHADTLRLHPCHRVSGIAAGCYGLAHAASGPP